MSAHPRSTHHNKRKHSSESVWDSLNNSDTARWVIGFAVLVTVGLTFMAYHRFYEPHHTSSDKFIFKQTLTDLNSAVATPAPIKIESVQREEAAVAVERQSNVRREREPVISTPLPVAEQRSISFDEIHFVHIPKCGGTTMTTVLRKIMCVLDPARNVDCCTNPGFCDWHSHRRCASIKGCINHFPNRKLIFKPIPSIAVFREPTSRLLSAWFYRGHSPNLDFFQVRPYFKEIAEGKRPRVTFPEYLEMVEYQNIQTRMLGADSFPYRNITITGAVFEKAAAAMDELFFVGLQEEFEISAKALIREMGVPEEKRGEIGLANEREQGSHKQIKKQKKEIVENDALMQRVREVNDYDIQLYNLAVKKFCNVVRKYDDLFEQVKQRGKVHCEL